MPNGCYRLRLWLLALGPFSNSKRMTSSQVLGTSRSGVLDRFSQVSHLPNALHPKGFLRPISWQPLVKKPFVPWVSTSPPHLRLRLPLRAPASQTGSDAGRDVGREMLGGPKKRAKRKGPIAGDRGRRRWLIWSQDPDRSMGLFSEPACF